MSRNKEENSKFFDVQYTLSLDSVANARLDSSLIGDGLSQSKNNDILVSDYFDRNFDFMKYISDIELHSLDDFETSVEVCDYIESLLSDLQAYSQAKFDLQFEYDFFISFLLVDVKYKSLSDYVHVYGMFCQNLHIKLCNNMIPDSLDVVSDSINAKVIDSDKNMHSVDVKLSEKTLTNIRLIKRIVVSFNYIMNDYMLNEDDLDLMELMLKFNQREDVNKNKLLKNIQRGMYAKRSNELPEFNLVKIYEQVNDYNGDLKDCELEFISEEYTKLLAMPFEYMFTWLHLSFNKKLNSRVTNVMQMLIEMFLIKLNVPVYLLGELQDILIEDEIKFSSIRSSEQFIEEMSNKVIDVISKVNKITEDIYLYALEFANENGLDSDLNLVKVIFLKEKYRFSWNTSKEQFYVALKIPRNKWSDYDLICEQWDKYLEYKYKG